MQTAAYRNRQSRQATCWVPDVQRVARQRWKLDQAFGRRLGCAACAAERITRNPDAGGWSFTGGGSVGIDPASGELQGRAIGPLPIRQHEIRPRLSDNDLFTCLRWGHGGTKCGWGAAAGFCLPTRSTPSSRDFDTATCSRKGNDWNQRGRY